MSFCHFRCDFDDTAQYRVSAMNSKGELSAFASVVVKSMSNIIPLLLSLLVAVINARK